MTLFLVFWWIELAILRSHRQGYQNFIFNFEDTRKRKQIKQSMLLTFLWLLKIVRPSDWKYKKRDYKIYPWISQRIVYGLLAWFWENFGVNPYEPFHTQHCGILHIDNKSLCESSIKKSFQYQIAECCCHYKF